MAGPSTSASPVAAAAKAAASKLAALDKSLAKTRWHEYPNEFWFYCVAFIGLVAVCQFLSFLHTKLSRSGRSGWKDIDPEKSRAAPRQMGPISLSRIPVAAVNVFRVLAFRTSVGFGGYTLNLAEVAITILYMGGLFTWTFVNSTSIVTHDINVTYWANRAGFLAASQFPLLAALGTKNNFISLLIGVSYDRLNYVHRMMARSLMVLLWIHVAGKAAQNSITDDIMYGWLRWGFVALIALTILIALSVRPVRNKKYELFFYAHFVLVLVFLIGGYFHTAEFQYGGPLAAAIIVWALDRLVRFARLVINNNSFSSKYSSNALEAHAEIVTNKLIRLVVRQPSRFHWKPGQTAYLTIPSLTHFPLEAHPFTIGSYDGAQSQNITPASPFWKELVFLINVRGGVTRKLKQAATQEGSINVLVDGPYGDAHDLRCFSSCTLIAGGSGVSYTVPVLLDIIESVRSGESNCQRILFLWTIRAPEDIAWCSDALLRALMLAPTWLDISIRIFVTGRDSSIVDFMDNLRKNNGSVESMGSWGGADTRSITEESFGSSVEDLKKPSAIAALTSLPSVSVVQGRPDFTTELRNEVDIAPGRMSVSVCGSQAVAKSIRRALSFPVGSPSRILRGGASVTLFIEAFGFA